MTNKRIPSPIRTAIDSMLEPYGGLDALLTAGPGAADRLLSIRDTATMLAVHDQTIWRLLRSGQLHRVKIGGATRIRLSDVQALIGGLE